MNEVVNASKTEFHFISGLFAGSNTEQVHLSLKAISHPMRLKILCLISKKEANVKELVSELGTTQSNVSQHLRILKDGGVVASTRVDNYSFYRIICPATRQIIGKS